VTVLALDGTQWAGIAGIVFGLVWLRFFRAIADEYNRLERAKSRAIEPLLPRRGRSTLMKWLTVGEGDDIPSRWLRYSISFLVGLVAVLVGIAAVAGAWAQ